MSGLGRILDDLNRVGVRYPLSFEELSVRAETRRVDGVEAPICSLADLVALKRIAGRERNLVDLNDLAAAHGELPDSRTDAPAR